MTLLSKKKIWRASLVILSLAFTIPLFIVLFLTVGKDQSTRTDHEWNTPDSLQFCLMNFEINLRNTGSLVSEFMPVTDVIFDSIMKGRDQPILILRIKESDCKICTDHELEVMDQYLSNFVSNTVVLGSYSSEKMLRIALRRVKTNFVSLNFGELLRTNHRIEQDGGPYYFVLHPNKTVSHIFIPDKIFPDLSRLYLESIGKLLDNEL